jgi:hypothetical protein
MRLRASGQHALRPAPLMRRSDGIRHTMQCRGRGLTGRALRLAAMVDLASVGLLSTLLGTLGAQAADRPTLSVPATVTGGPATQIPFPIRVGPPPSVPHNSFVRVRGLPPMAALYEAHSIAPGSWAIPLRALTELTIVLPAITAGKSEFAVALVAMDGSVLDETKAMLVIDAPSPAGAHGQSDVLTTSATRLSAATALPAPLGAERPSPMSPSPHGAASAIFPEHRERAFKLLKNGDEQLAQGNVAAARPFYELAALAGLAQAAMALASTYDAAELARLNVRGIEPNGKEAVHWYERARQLGADGADQRLRRLGAD